MTVNLPSLLFGVDASRLEMVGVAEATELAMAARWAVMAECRIEACNITNRFSLVCFSQVSVTKKNV